VTTQAADVPAQPGFHGWRLVAAAGGLQFLMAGLMIHSFGAYVAVLRDSEGWSKTALSGVAAMQQVEAALLGPLQGWIADRHGSRGMVRAGVLSFAVGLMLLGTATSLASFYAIYLLIALGMGLAGYYSLSIVVVNWFERFRSRALSIVMLGMVVGGFVAPAIAWSMQTYGWRRTAFASGLVALIVGWPLAGMLHRRPEDLGQHVDGLAPADRASASADSAGASAEGASSPPPPVPLRDATVHEALRSRTFWLLGLGHAFALLVVATVNVHAVTHIKEGLGYSLTQAASMLTVQAVAYAAGVFVSGATGDRWNKSHLSAGCLLLHAFGLFTLAHASSWAAVLVAVVAHGFAWGLRGPLMNALRADHFGRQAIGTILGLSMLIVLLGQVGGPMIAGVLADATGNYRLGFTILAALAGVGSLFFLLVPQPPTLQRGATE
jgi:MFS family permease